MEGCMDGWMVEWMDGQIAGQLGRNTDVWMNERTEGKMDS